VSESARMFANAATGGARERRAAAAAKESAGRWAKSARCAERASMLAMAENVVLALSGR
jgi:hypothetical protein